jgi:sugar/nucleoside kinase (ribokinase family)
MSDGDVLRILAHVDLLCINLDEARSALRQPAGEGDPGTLVERTVRTLTAINPGILISITHGRQGSYVWDGSALTYLVAYPVEVASSAGAGDAFTSGMIAGVVSGFPCSEAQHLATLAGSYSVTSPDTIHKGLNRSTLLALARNGSSDLSPDVLSFLEA